MIYFFKNLSTVLDSFQPLIFIAFVILGWLFLRANSHKFARRTERNGLINDIIDINAELLEFAYEYWITNNISKEQLELKVSNSFDRTIFKLKILKRYNILISHQELAKLRALIMSKSRDSDMVLNHITFQKISHKINTISNNLENSLLIKNTSTVKNLVTNLELVYAQYPTVCGLLTGAIIMIIYLVSF